MAQLVGRAQSTVEILRPAELAGFQLDCYKHSTDSHRQHWPDLTLNVSRHLFLEAIKSDPRPDLRGMAAMNFNELFKKVKNEYYVPLEHDPEGFMMDDYSCNSPGRPSQPRSYI